MAVKNRWSSGVIHTDKFIISARDLPAYGLGIFGIISMLSLGIIRLLKHDYRVEVDWLECDVEERKQSSAGRLVDRADYPKGSGEDSLRQEECCCR